MCFLRIGGTSIFSNKASNCGFPILRNPQIMIVATIWMHLRLAHFFMLAALHRLNWKSWWRKGFGESWDFMGCYFQSGRFVSVFQGLNTMNNKMCVKRDSTLEIGQSQNCSRGICIPGSHLPGPSRVLANAPIQIPSRWQVLRLHTVQERFSPGQDKVKTPQKGKGNDFEMTEITMLHSAPRTWNQQPFTSLASFGNQALGCPGSVFIGTQKDSLYDASLIESQEHFLEWLTCNAC